MFWLYLAGIIGTMAAAVTLLVRAIRAPGGAAHRDRVIGAVIGVVVVAVAIAVTRESQLTLDWMLVAPAVLGAAVVGCTVGAAVAGYRRDAAPVGARTARLVPLTVAHYVTRLERIAPTALVGGVTVVYLIVLALAASVVRTQAAVPTLLAPGILVAAAVTGLVLCRFASAALLRRGQPAHDEGELRADDAARASTFRALCAVPVALAAAALIGVVTTTVYAVADTATFTPTLLVGAIPAVLLLVAAGGFLHLAVAARSRAATHYARRLWSARA